MAEATKTTRTRATRKPAAKKEIDVKSLEKALATLSKRCDALEAKCAKLEKSNNSSSSGDNGLSETRWAALKLFLEKRFGRGYLKSTGLWGL